jgi:hypothetical protein
MTLRERENRIFRRYRSMGEQIISDGAMSPEYESAQARLLVILKEANDPDGSWASSGGDLRSYGRWGGRPATWKNLALWSALIEDPRIELFDIDVSDRAKRVKHLTRIAVVNLKKVPGGARSDLRVIRNYALEHRTLLEQQLMLYKPHLTLAGGTFDVLKVLREKPEITDQGKCFRYFLDPDLGICVDFYHPQQRKLSRGCVFEYLRQQLVYHKL